MALNQYGPCPCGSGKKIKFCCKDLAGEIEKILKMVHGDQLVAAHRRVDQALKKHPGRPSFLELKAVIELRQQDYDAARRTIDEFVVTHPESSNAWANLAQYCAETDQAEQAVEALQRCLELVEDTMPRTLHQSILSVGVALLQDGQWFAARAHLVLYQRSAQEDDTRAVELLVRLNSLPGLPLFLREHLPPRESDADQPWVLDFDRAMELTGHGSWSAASSLLAPLVERSGDAPEVVYNLALLRGYLGRDAEMVDGLRRYARLDVPRDDAIEAEAIAQVFDPRREQDHLDVVRFVYPVDDVDMLNERLRGDGRAVPVDTWNYQSDEEDAPAPITSYVLLDREEIGPGDDLELTNIPNRIADVAVFGRETNREPRAEFVATRNDALEESVTFWRELAAPHLGERTSEDVVDITDRMTDAMEPAWHITPGTPLARIVELSTQDRQHRIKNVWPETPQSVLGGATPRSLGDVAERQIELEAAVLCLQAAGPAPADFDAIRELRESLHLPSPEPLDASTVDAQRFPLIRIHRLDFEALSDEALVDFYGRVKFALARGLLRDLAAVAAHRPAVHDRLNLTRIYRDWLSSVQDMDKVAAIADEARSATAADTNEVEWDLLELNIYLDHYDGDRLQNMLLKVKEQYGDRPEVIRTVYGLLESRGLVVHETQESQQAADPMAATLESAEATSPGRKIWTPDSEPSSKPKSAIWTP